jgi:hypothetical protein
MCSRSVLLTRRRGKFQALDGDFQALRAGARYSVGLDCEAPLHVHLVVINLHKRTLSLGRKVPESNASPAHRARVEYSTSGN